MQRPLRPPSAVATGSDVWQRIAHRRGQNHEDIHSPATTPAQCDAAHNPCRVQGRQARAWRLRRGAVARHRADPRQAKEAAREALVKKYTGGGVSLRDRDVMKSLFGLVGGGGASSTTLRP